MNDGPECEGGGGRPPVEEGAPLWTVTFGDMMSLLLTFFILLFSMSELKVERFMLASQSMRDAMGGTAPESSESPLGPMAEPSDSTMRPQGSPGVEAASADAVGSASGPTEMDEIVDAYMGMITDRLSEFVRQHSLEESVTIQRDGDGVYLRMETGALFPSGSARIQPEGLGALGELAEVTSGISVRVVVSGHADNAPIVGGQYESNWELSAARAAGVARQLVMNGQDPLRIRAESYGEYRPIADNATPEGRAQNRRVDLMYARSDIVEAVRSWTRIDPIEMEGDAR